MADSSGDTVLTTPLNALHRELGGRMVPFAGYDMPVQFPAGIMAEHNHTRTAAGLFDVSHMGQVRITGPDPVAAIERLVPGDIAALQPGRMRYTMFTDDRGGILDDLMVTRRENDLFVVVNAACKAQDIAHLRAGLSDHTVEELADRALLALQGPAAAAVMARLAPEAVKLGFMSGAEVTVAGHACFVTRSGYTGEDGFEISVPDTAAEALARLLLAEAEVKPIGLGARDSLRLEAGLCLYGHDIDTTTSPIEAALAWTISKRRREQGGFPGAVVIQDQLARGTARKRVGIQPEGRAPAREGTPILDPAGNRIGTVTSGGFGPTVNAPVAMGYVATGHHAAGTPVALEVRGKMLPAKVAAMPFAPHRYAK
jgi:aminomethyltransferase